MNQPNSPIVGIDLGTTNSVVAALVDGKVQVLAEGDETILPSVVGLDASGKLITGTTARNQLAAFPDRTIASVKRKMGSDETVELGDQSFTPPEISAMILKRLMERASHALGTPVSRAVITVPAFFDDRQRQATREAGQLAGLTVERIINEPTAATLVYHADCETAKNVVIYDFGGGTFDVSIVRTESGVVEVLSSKGDTQLGGDDLDEALFDHVAFEFMQQNDVDLRQDASTRYRLLQACEAAKRQLSQLTSVEIAEEFIAEKDGQPLNLKMTVTREKFEELIETMIGKTISCVDAALRDAQLTLDQVDDLVLVGGSTRVPLVERRLLEEFDLLPSRAVDPDLAVALGAATQAAMLDGYQVGPVLVDITSHTLGVVVVDSLMGMQEVTSQIIRRNSPLPATYEELYRRTHQNQEYAIIEVVQGESFDPEKNRRIGEFNLDLNTDDGTSDQISVRFELTLDGVLKVTARQLGTDQSGEITIDNAIGDDEEFQAASPERLEEMFAGSDELGNEIESSKLRFDSGGSFKQLPNIKKYPAAESLLNQSRQASQGNAEDRAEMQQVASSLEKAIAKDDAAKVATLCEELDDILFYVQG